MNQSYAKTKSMGLAILILVNLLFIPFYSSKALDHQGDLVKILNDFDLEIEEFNINAHVSLDKIFMDPMEAKIMIKGLAESLRLEEISLEDYSVEENTQINLEGVTENENTVMIVQAAKTEDVVETNIIVDVTSKDSKRDLKALEETIRKVMSPYGNAEITTCITASKKEQLSIARQKQTIRDIMECLEVTEVEVFSDGNIVSMTGFSNMIDQWKQYNNKKVNINMAMRYSTYENKTYLWLGSPFITIGY